MVDDTTESSTTRPVSRLLWQAGRLSLWLRVEGDERAAVLLEGAELRGLWLLPRRGPAS